MNRDEIIRMARDTGCLNVADYGRKSYEFQSEELERFAALVAAASASVEREACAKVCDDIDTEYEGDDVLATWCAAAIRARGQE